MLLRCLEVLSASLRVSIYMTERDNNIHGISAVLLLRLSDYA
jgi:hypothetical protein